MILRAGWHSAELTQVLPGKSFSAKIQIIFPLPSRTKKVVPDDAVLVSVEGFLLEVAEESWVELSCLVLSDAARKIQLTTYTQSTPVDPAFVAAAKSATPGTHPKLMNVSPTFTY